MKYYGIFFKHPRTNIRGYDIVKDDNWINIECKDEKFNVESILNNLNENWNSNKKLFKLQLCGNVLKLGTNVENSKTELSEFKKNYKKVKTYIDFYTGDVEYSNQEDILKVPFYVSENMETAMKECVDYDWSYAFFYDEETKKFIPKEINL